MVRLTDTMMRKIMSLIALGMALIGVEARGQQPIWGSQVLTGPEGAMVPVLNQALQFTHFRPGARTVIHKAVGKTEKWTKVAEVVFPENVAAFRKRLGSDKLARMKADYELANDEAAYAFYANESIDKIVLYAFSKEYMEAFGLIHIDKGWKKGQLVRYRIEHYQGDALSGQIELSADPEYTVYPDQLEIGYRLVTDSLVSVAWQTPVSSFQETIGVQAEIFKRTGQAGYQSARLNIVSRSAGSDSSFVHYQERVRPGQAYAYYAQLKDWVGNYGLPSDTLYALAYDPGSVQAIATLRAAADSDGVRLTWDPLPSEAIYTGIEVLKSRNYDSAYVVLDTIAAHEVGYLDNRVLNGSMYYYRVKPVFISGADEDFIKYAEASVVTAYSEGYLAPAAPEGVYATTTDQGVRIRWWAPEGLDTYGYYVLRGSTMGNMELISGSVRDTVYVDSLLAKGYSGQMHYAVLAMNQNQQLSDTSQVVTVAVRQPQVLMAPGGLAVRVVPGGVYLRWNAVMELDDRVSGYAVFRRVQGSEEFDAVHAGPLLLPDYTDTTAVAGTAYEYAVSTHDVWGNYSVLSPISQLTADPLAEGMEAPLSIHLRNLTRGVEVSWPVSLTDGGGEYAVYRKAGETGGFVKIGNTPAQRFYVDATVTADTAYEYYVVPLAGNREGAPGPSKVIRR